LGRTKPRHRCLAVGSNVGLLSSSESSISGHSIVGKAIDSSTCWEAVVNSLISRLSKDPILDRERFELKRWLADFVSLVRRYVVVAYLFSLASLGDLAAMPVPVREKKSLGYCTNHRRKGERRRGGSRLSFYNLRHPWRRVPVGLDYLYCSLLFLSWPSVQ
jgi:hypothetical protein